MYKNKVIFLLSIIGILALLYAGSFIFSPEKSNKRIASFVLLDHNQSSGIDKIVINTHEQEYELLNKNQDWFISLDGIEFPARALRIEDFISVFTKRDSWPVRANSASTHASFGLDSTEADRIILYNGNNALLDVLVGYGSAFGSEVSIRKYAQNEVRSGDSRVRTYISSPVSSWYDLKLFPEEDGKTWSADSVQQLTVINDDGEQQVFNRQNRAWQVSNVSNPDNTMIESYIRTVLNTEGDNFIGLISNTEDFPAFARIIVEFGNGKIETVHFSPPDESGNRFAYVYGKEYLYSVPAWSGNRLFREASSFEMQ